MKKQLLHIELLKNTKKKPRDWIKSCFLFLIVLLVGTNAFATNYYISSSEGNDNNPGNSPNLAWKSLTKVNKFSPAPGDSILFKRGDYWEGTITLNSSGSENNNIVFAAYGTGEDPIIYGSEKIRGWTLYKGNIYKTTVKNEINQLFLDNERMQVARFPNSGYFDVSSVAGSTRFSSSNLATNINYSKAKLHIKTNEWRLDNMDVVYSSGQQITINSKTSYGLKPGQKFYLCNKLEFLDKAGQWYYDPQSETLYFWTPLGDSPENYEVRGSVYNNGVEIFLKQNLVIRDLQLKQHSSKGFYIEKCNSITIANNKIEYIESNGISAKGNNLKILENSVNGSNQFAITVGGNDAVVSDNNCLNTALFDNLGINGMNGMSYVMSVGGNNNKVTYNKIINSGYTGISWTGKNCTIAYNLIENLMQVLSDGGAIYTYSRNIQYQIVKGSVIKNNIILDLNRGTAGIYMDERTRDVIIENNTVAHCKGYAVFYHDNKNIEARNNVLFDNGKGMRATGTFGGNKFYKNILCNLANTKDGKYSPSLVLLHPDEQTLALDSNIYIDRHFKFPFRNTKNYNYQSFDGWKQTMKQDANSVFNPSELKSAKEEKLFYNPGKLPLNIDLGTSVYLNVSGEKITGSITLQPFTSIILFKTGERVSGNLNPVIKDQSFYIQGKKNINEIIGQVLATDPDSGQRLTYSIIGGNDQQFFDIDPYTGRIFTKTMVELQKKTSFVIVVQVTDDASSPLTARANITINISEPDNTDVTNPIISSFIIPDSAKSLIIPVLTLSAYDDRSITGYLLSETVAQPTPADERWQKNIPDSYSFFYPGIKTLYAWVKDEAGNISKSATAQINISLPEVLINEFVSICQGENYLGWDTAGQYNRKIESNLSVDTIVFTTLEVNPSYQITEDITIKKGENYLGWITNGTYSRTLTTMLGCDSVITTNLHVLEPLITYEEIEICEGESYFGWNKNGNYRRTLTAASGADSIINTTLFVNPVYFNSENVTINQGKNYQGWDQPGVYRRTLTSKTGCDSVVETQLEVALKFNINFPDFDYYTNINISDTISSFDYYTRMKNLENIFGNDSNLLVYPNPAHSHIYVYFKKTPESSAILQIINNNGKLIYNKLAVSEINRINITHFKKGSYILRLIKSNKMYTSKLIIN